MNVISGEMNPGPPDWLSDVYRSLEAEGFSFDDVPNEALDQYTERGVEIALEYLSLRQNDPDEAIKSIPAYLRRFDDINDSVNILNSLTPDQFGLIINIASRGYDPVNDEARAYCLYSQVDDFLSNKRSDKIGSFTACLRNPELLRDLVAHWEAVNYPNTGDYTGFLSGNSDWENVSQQIDLNQNNPALFALTIPQASTDPMIRVRFQETYPESSRRGIDIIAARLFNKGAHEEHLREANHGESSRYKEWEATIYEGLDGYAEEYRFAILKAITEANWHVFDEKKFNFPGLPEKLLGTSFSLDENDRLVRKNATRS